MIMKAVLVLQQSVIHLMGTVSRNQDGHFIQDIIDLNIIITEEPLIGDFSKPDEILHIIEHFCLGTVVSLHASPYINIWLHHWFCSLLLPKQTKHFFPVRVNTKDT